VTWQWDLSETADVYYQDGKIIKGKRLRINVSERKTEVPEGNPPEKGRKILSRSHEENNDLYR